MPEAGLLFIYFEIELELINCDIQFPLLVKPEYRFKNTVDSEIIACT